MAPPIPLCFYLKLSEKEAITIIEIGLKDTFNLGERNEVVQVSTIHKFQLEVQKSITYSCRPFYRQDGSFFLGHDSYPIILS